MNISRVLLGISSNIVFGLGFVFCVLFSFILLYLILGLQVFLSLAFSLALAVCIFYGVSLPETFEQRRWFKKTGVFLLLTGGLFFFIFLGRAFVIKGVHLTSFFQTATTTIRLFDDTVIDKSGIKTYPGKLEILSDYYRLLARKKVFGYEGVEFFEENILGTKMAFNNYDQMRFLFEEIFIDKPYMFISEKSDPFIIDCGSNIGLTVLFFKKLYPKAKILAFEADPTTFELLEQNIPKNDFPDVELFNYAVSNQQGVVNFFSEKPGSGINRMVDKRYSILSSMDISDSTILSVKSVPLSDYINESKEVDLLKMDIEGAENLVMEDLVKTGKIKFIKEIVLEYHHQISHGNKPLLQMLSWLDESDFVYQINPEARIPFNKKNWAQNFMIHAYRKA